MACKNCGNIIQDRMPLPSKAASMELKCPECDYFLIIFYGIEHNFSKYMIKEDPK